MSNIAQSGSNGRIFSDSGDLGFKLLQPTGLALVSVAIVWWLLFYGRIGGENTIVCAFYTASQCDVIASSAELAGYLAYHPFVMWLGLVCLIIGFILPMTGHGPKRETINKVALAWTFVGIPLLWGVMQTLINSMKLFQ
jgi:hypothetical protein